MVFPPQHIGLDDHNTVMQVILIGDPVALCDGFIVDALEGRFEQFLLNLPSLINDALSEKLHNFRVVMSLSGISDVEIVGTVAKIHSPDPDIRNIFILAVTVQPVCDVAL